MCKDELKAKQDNLQDRQPIVPGLPARVALFARRVLEQPRIVLSTLHWFVAKHVLRRRFMVKTIMGHRFRLDLRVGGISRALAIYGEREPSHEAWIRGNVKSGMVVVDLGANIGYYALLEASLVRPGGRVYAIEPDPRNLDLLRLNLEANGAQDVVEVHELAICDRDGTAPFLVARQSNLSSLFPATDSGASDTVQVRTAALRSFLKGKRSPDLVRMDIEGGEVEVLEELARGLNSLKPGFRVFLELHQHVYCAARGLEPPLTQLLDSGFRVKLIVACPGHELSDLGYSPVHSVYGLGAFEHMYEEIERSDAIRLACDHPQRIRYLCLEKTV